MNKKEASKKSEAPAPTTNPLVIKRLKLNNTDDYFINSFIQANTLLYPSSKEPQHMGDTYNNNKPLI